MSILRNEDLIAHLDLLGLGDVRQDIPFEDAVTKLLWSEALAAQKSAADVLKALRTHLKMPDIKTEFYCGCCEEWHQLK